MLNEAFNRRQGSSPLSWSYGANLVSQVS